ncbi:cobalt-precorrin-6A reductase [Mangrovicella endophytica]|uniref:cobalt-precorrin-6A reductase n=1 Tax=Mangrovicella endophytica TaxID=2066697 RepID=UPI000C9E58CC|nr:cobalt-precorrin-6A reductase [Mangrovicella endophytica]
MPAETILILGGTAEAAALARRITTSWPERRLIVSLAGRTAAPAAMPGTLRIGGFGGADGLAAFLTDERIGRLVDATHPFAAGISRNAAKATTRAGVPRLMLQRPGWTPVTGDNWTSVACLGAARDALPPGARPFLALGSQHLKPFAQRPDLRAIVRMVDPSAEPLPFAAEIILGKPSGDAADEAALLARTRATHLVCRNSGGSASYGKVKAARHLGLPVIMIERPPAPPGPSVASVDEVMAWFDG